MEHDVFGCFVTVSPLDEFQNIISEFCAGSIADMCAVARPASAPGQKSPRQAMTLAGLITSVRPHVDRSGREMVFVKMEDGTGWLDLVLFHDAYESNKSLVSVGTAVLAKGRLEKRGTSVTLITDQLVGMDQPERLYESILIKLDEGVGLDIMKKLKDLLREYPGDRPVCIEMSESGSTFEFRVGWSCRPASSLRRQLESLLGPYSVFFLKSQGELSGS